MVPSVSGAPQNTGPLQGNCGALQQLKQLHPSLKVLISLAGVAGFSSAAGTANGREAFVANCIDRFIKRQCRARDFRRGVFDGIDIDWE